MRPGKVVVLGTGLLASMLAAGVHAQSRRTVKPVIHGRHWVAVTGKPLAATAGALIFDEGRQRRRCRCGDDRGHSTMWDTLGWGGETQALLIRYPHGKGDRDERLGVAPTGATAAFYRSKNMKYPPELGPLAAVTPGTPGAMLVMLAEWGKLT